MRPISREASLLSALLPLYIHDLSELEISRVGGEQASRLRVAGTEADLGVDVEHAISSARRPDDRGAVGLVVLEVIAGKRSDEVVLGGALFGS